MIDNSYMYYKSRLNENDCIVYEKIYKGIESQLNTIGIENSLFSKTRTPFMTIFDYVLLDHPRIYYIDKRTVYTYNDVKNRWICFKYLYNFNKIDQLNNDINKALSIIVESGVNAGFSSPYEWELYLHDYIASSIKYENDNKTYHKLHSVIGPLLYSRSVCEGNAKLFKLLCDEVNISCIVVNGTVNEEKLVVGGNHSWNMVMIEGEWYHVDSTWDNGYTREEKVKCSHRLFNVCDEDIRADHLWNENLFNKCTYDKYNFFTYNNCSFNDLRDSKDFISKAITKGKDKIAFKLINKPDKEEVYSEIPKVVLSAIYDKKKKIGISYSYDNKRGVVELVLT